MSILLFSDFHAALFRATAMRFPRVGCRALLERADESLLLFTLFDEDEFIACY